MFKRGKFPQEVYDYIFSNLDKTGYFLRSEIKKRFGIVVAEGMCCYYIRRYKKGIKSKPRSVPSFFTKKIGAERINKDGYIAVLISPAKEKLKHHIVWEEANGKIDTRKDMIIFLDGDRTNCALENLLLTKRKNIGAINYILSRYKDVTPRIRKMAVTVAELMIKTKEKDREQRNKRRAEGRVRIKKKKKEYIKKVISMIDEGLSDTEIAKICNRRASTIWSIRRKHNLGFYDNPLIWS